jgi:hypothetical protein
MAKDVPAPNQSGKIIQEVKGTKGDNSLISNGDSFLNNIQHPHNFLPVLLYISAHNEGVTIGKTKDGFTTRGNPKHLQSRREIANTIRFLESCGYIEKTRGWHQCFVITPKGRALI